MSVLFWVLVIVLVLEMVRAMGGLDAVWLRVVQILSVFLVLCAILLAANVLRL